MFGARGKQMNDSIGQDTWFGTRPAAWQRPGATGLLGLKPLALESADASTARTQAAAEAGTTSDQQPLASLPADALIIVPVRNMVLFPGIVVPVSMGRERSVAAVQEAARGKRQVGFVLQRDDAVEQPGADDLYRVGTVANLLRYVATPDGGHHVVAQGEERFRVVQFLDGYPFIAARVERIPDSDSQSIEIEARFLRLKERAAEVLALLPQAPPEIAATAQAITSPSAMADFVAGLMDVPAADKQQVLETTDLRMRLDRVLEMLGHRLEVLRLSREIDSKTKERLEGHQREALLREQMKTIQAQLGDDDGSAAENAGLADAVAKAGMPEDVEKQVRKELKRLERMPEQAGEYSMLRTWLDLMVELPWRADAPADIDVGHARKVLDDDHFGLERVKRRILEFLAVRKLNPEGRSPILCFVGPPGVGKTSLGQSIARAMGRKFVRVSLGGVHDEAEIRGHRRTYIGALPGNVIQGIRKAGSRNAVMMLDEMDKLGASVRGDPSAAMLEVLDPEQNGTFRDHYLGVPFDLSGVTFIATANALDQIPGPLRDRMEVIELPGYTEEEKLQIARRYLVDRQLKANGLAPGRFEVSDDTLRAIIGEYTREAGVRNLEREIGAVCRHAAMKLAEGAAEVTVTPADLPAIIQRRKFENEVAMRTAVPGVATGLAWTPVGGDILFIEASRMPGSGKLILTGQLGDVMKESAQAALTLLKSHAADYGVDPQAFDKSDIHVHIPAGAIPKDGPSAGVAMFIALTSLVTNRRVRHDLAMTGEISLRGLVLPVGGIKEKVLAALRAGIRSVMLPGRNRADVEEIPASAREQITFTFLDTVEDAMRVALVAN
jgi:ATP-dependent Lon protease